MALEAQLETTNDGFLIMFSLRGKHNKDHPFWCRLKDEAEVSRYVNDECIRKLTQIDISAMQSIREIPKGTPALDRSKK